MDDVGYAGNYFKGLIDDARVYNRALGAAEVLYCTTIRQNQRQPGCR